MRFFVGRRRRKMSEWIISSSVLIVLVIALRHVLRGKISLRLQYALWLVVLVRLLMPVSIADSSFSIASFLQKNQTHQISDIFLWYGGETNPGGVGEFLPDSEQGNPQVGGENTGNLPGNVTTPIKPDAGATDKPPVTDEPVKYPTIGGVSIAPSTDKLQNSGKARISLSEILMIIWCAGMAVTAVMLLVSNLHFSKKLKKTRWLYERKTDALPVYESDAVETPCLFGLVRPAIYVTQEAIKDPKIMHHVLAHETTHYAHRDHIWAVLRCLCLVLHWYNPLVWWAADLSRRDAELACDEGTIERIGEAVRVEYGRTLIGLTCQGRGYLLSTATTMTGSVKGIKERIMLIANRPKMARYTVMLLIVLVMVMIGCTYCGVKETDVGAGKKEESTESVEHVSESVDESTTEAVETEASTEEPIEETTEAVSEELPSEEPTEEPTTEEPTTENPFERVGAEEIEYVLTPSEDYFRFIAKSIEKVDNKYVITGDMVWGGLVLLTEEQKTKLDNGAILKVVYDNTVLERYVATDRQAEFHRHQDAHYYDAEFGYGDVLNEMTPSTISDMMLERYGEWVKRLDGEPYNGKGYCLMKDFPSWPCDFVVETNCQWEVSGDLSFYPESYLTCHGRMDSAEEVWTMERFYQEAIVGDKYSSQGILHHVYVKDGVIVKIIEQYVS